MPKSFVFVFIYLTNVIDAYTLTRIGSFSAKHAAFTSLHLNSQTKGNNSYNLLISTFGAPSLFGASDSVLLVRDIGSKLNNIASISPELLTTKVTWPNEVVAVPDNIFTSETIVIPDGFLVPFKTKGAIKIMEITNGNINGPYTLSETDSAGDWFYHRVEWFDMDGDGDQDIVTCRAREPAIPLLFGKEDEELIWLENPSGNFKSGTWNTHVLTHGPGVYFRFAQMNTNEGVKNVVFTAQFFTKSLSVYWTTQQGGLFTDPSKIQSRVIDNQIGSVFEVEVTDLNNDGKPDLLVTTNGSNGTLLAYQIPDDFRTGTFIKHTIDVGFRPRTSGIGKGAPGSAFTIYPNIKDTNMKPTVLLSGDDDGRAYIYEPLTQDPLDWSYNKTTFCDAGSGTVGEVSAADIDGDGLLEIIVPSYTTGDIFIYSYKQSRVEPGMVVG
ncbi:hypothetical protein ACF0H5_016417 [Mactra antiquata]